MNINMYVRRVWNNLSEIKLLENTKENNGLGRMLLP